MNIPAGAEWPVLLVVVAVLVVLPLFALVDVIRRPAEQWKAAGHSQTLWIVLIAVGLVACGLGPIVALVYLWGVRPKLEAHA